ncbi:hypothetical protein ED733_001338 [Metarhizium rileyi]|uniref:Uncharacterized protein n=1 Tax=Metarhizium rileyi (strain RCEF 4871) TaxID=1649241 RepID=A0A5C6GAN7_METRR|nr:hypothetical protein ED733_001338 [Metarhizium rileyi]
MNHFTACNNEPRIPYLPLELILDIVEYFRPEIMITVLPPTHEITKTLLATRLICKAVNSKATQILLQHAMYISSDKKAEILAAHLRVNQLSEEPGIPQSFQSLFTNFSFTKNLVLDLFPYYNYNFTLPQHRALKTIFQSNMRQENTGYTILGYPGRSRIVPPNDASQTALAVYSILRAVRKSLRSLVISIPLWILPYDAVNIIRKGFECLQNLRECCSVQDKFTLILPTELQLPAMPGYWMKLRRLQLYRPKIGRSELWKSLAEIPSLRTVVFAHPDGEAGDFNLKQYWLDAVDAVNRGTSDRPPKFRFRSREMNIILVDF